MLNAIFYAEFVEFQFFFHLCMNVTIPFFFVICNFHSKTITSHKVTKQ